MRVEAAPNVWINLPDDATPAEIQQAADDAAGIRRATPIKNPTTAAVEAGTRGGIAALQGPSFGFSDELLGGLGALGGYVGTKLAGGDANIGDLYTQKRDEYRAMEKQAREQNPTLTTATQLAAAAPTMIVGGGLRYGIKGTGTLANIGRGAASGGATGAVSGAGHSEANTLGGLVGDTVMGAGAGAALGGGMPALGAGIRAVTPDKVGQIAGSLASQVNTRIGSAARRSGVAMDYAKEKVAQGLVRDLPGTNEAKRTVEEAVRRGTAMGGAIGGDARVVDVGGKSTQRMLDTLASLPGETANRVERVIRERQATAGRDISSAASKLLIGRSSNYADDLAAAEAERSAVAAPLYDQLRGVKFTADDELSSLLSRAEDYVSEAAKRAKVRGESEILKGAAPGSQISLDSLNTLKSTLWDAAEALKREGKGGAARELKDLRMALKNKIDDLSPKDSEGRSIARLADDAWSGAEQYRAAIEAGRNAMKSDDINLAQELRGLSQSEMEGYKIGAVQAIKAMAGDQSGRTKLINQWKNDTTGNKLRVLFGDKYNDFAQVLGAAEKKKAIESAGRGSQTMPREYARQDLDQSVEAAKTAASLSTSPYAGIMQMLVGRAQTPEPVRDQMGRLLLGPSSDLPSLLDIATKVNNARSQRAAAAGSFSGVGLPILAQ